MEWRRGENCECHDFPQLPGNGINKRSKWLNEKDHGRPSRADKVRALFCHLLVTLNWASCSALPELGLLICKTW